MNYAVKRYKFIDKSQKPRGIPDNMVAEVLFLGDKTKLPKGEGWELKTKEELDIIESAVNDEYQSWVSVSGRHTPEELALKKVKDAKAFGELLIDEFAINNMTKRKDDVAIDNILEKTDRIIRALKTGSLKSALREAKLVETDKDFTDEEIIFFANKIRQALGKKPVERKEEIDS